MKKIIYFIVVMTVLGILVAIDFHLSGFINTFPEALGFVGGYVCFALLIRGIVYLLTRQ